MTVRRPVPLRTLAGGGLALAAAMGIGRFAYTPILPAMQRAAELGTAKAGGLASANYAGYLVGALLVAAVPVGVARRRAILGQGLCVLGSCVWSTAASDRLAHHCASHARQSGPSAGAPWFGVAEQTLRQRERISPDVRVE